LLLLGDKIFTDKKYTEKVKSKRSTKIIFSKFSCKELNIFCNFKENTVDHYFCYVDHLIMIFVQQSLHIGSYFDIKWWMMLVLGVHDAVYGCSCRMWEWNLRWEFSCLYLIRHSWKIKWQNQPLTSSMISSSKLPHNTPSWIKLFILFF
jgi:hypothetical protein